jgi:hypothetical protein
VFPVGIGLRDPRSQKRDLGTLRSHPRYCRGHKLCHFLFRLASASRLLEMTKGRVVVQWRAAAGLKAFFIIFGPGNHFPS